jgi:hypothetical protein
MTTHDAFRTVRQLFRRFLLRILKSVSTLRFCKRFQCANLPDPRFAVPFRKTKPGRRMAPNP